MLKIRGNQAIDYDPVGRKCAESGDLIKPHQAAVALDVSCENRAELPFDGVRFQGSPPPRLEYSPTKRKIRASLSHSETRWSAIAVSDA